MTMHKPPQRWLAASLTYLAAINPAFAQPRITTQPAEQSVSLGANVTEIVTASSVNALNYQWRFNGTEIGEAISRTLILTNVQMADVGGYSVVVTDSSGSVTSLVARLDVDTAFVKITLGNLLTASDNPVPCAFGDYDADGFVDLFLGTVNTNPDVLYRNNGDGTFARLTQALAGPIVSTPGESLGCAWVDYDNDGLLDMFVANGGFMGNQENFLYRNTGQGRFERVKGAVAGRIVTDADPSFAASWDDFDHDGFVDLFVANGGFYGNSKNALYRNQGNGTFSRVTTGDLVNTSAACTGGIWGDYNNDGFRDLFLANYSGQKNALYRNNGDGSFVKMGASFVGSIATDVGNALGAAWGDYDNDGNLDLFVTTRNAQPNFLYHNQGDGTFVRVTNSIPEADITNKGERSHGCAWGDYDNDGYLDLFVVNKYAKNFLYHNNRDGTFTKITAGSFVNEIAAAGLEGHACAWIDFDNDGFLDLFETTFSKNALYHNNGNNNGWLSLKLVGTVSNRSAVGAKVRVNATIRGKSLWQLREVSSGGTFGSPNDLRACFGLGDATNIDIVRIEWPSGTVQEVRNVAPKQFLTFTEPARLNGSVAEGQYQLVLNGGIGFTYGVETSTNLVDWAPLTKVQTTNMTISIISAQGRPAGRQYFRALRQ
jgi:hypothetical protein